MSKILTIRAFYEGPTLAFLPTKIQQNALGKMLYFRNSPIPSSIPFPSQ